jgi:hypothetical protein
MRPMSEAPRDGTRILLCYYHRLYDHRTREYLRYESKWEECRYLPDAQGNPDRWNSWCGSENATSSLSITESDCLGWLPRPEEILV